jgi:hypothetical protein
MAERLCCWADIRRKVFTNRRLFRPLVWIIGCLRYIRVMALIRDWPLCHLLALQVIYFIFLLSFWDFGDLFVLLLFLLFSWILGLESEYL